MTIDQPSQVSIHDTTAMPTPRRMDSLLLWRGRGPPHNYNTYTTRWHYMYVYVHVPGSNPTNVTQDGMHTVAKLSEINYTACIDVGI